MAKKEVMNKQKTVFVGLSGGVDSAVSAVLLKQKGFEVVGVFIKTWHPNFLECNEEEERRDAMRIAAHLDIPFLTFDFEDVYKKEVGDYMISEYRAGRTPNPDVMCNKHVKFGAFLRKSLAMGADFVATGHYANISAIHPFTQSLGPSLPSATPSQKHVSLLKSPDISKDQSYFLWTLKQEQLNKILFPIGGLKKSEVRILAEKFKLPVATKKDSQGICFLGPVDLKEFLKHYIKEKKGKVVDPQGVTLGWHNGVVFSTLGERHGFTITKKTPHDKPYYIVGKDVKKNVLIVSQNKNILSKSNLSGTGVQANFSARQPAKGFSQEHFYLTLKNVNWISQIPEQDKKYTAQIRYHGELLPCNVKILSKQKAEVVFNKPTLVAGGQSIVLYDKDVCLGGGVVI